MFDFCVDGEYCASSSIGGQKANILTTVESASQTQPNWDVMDRAVFEPTAEEWALYGRYIAENHALLAKPADVPNEYIAYNPSAIWTVAEGIDVMYARGEPDRANGSASHLGKAFARPYIINPANPNQPLAPFDDGMEIPGEDPSLTRITRRLLSGKLERVWLLSVVDAQPLEDKPNEVKTLQTRFYTGNTLDALELTAVGPAWMKDIPVASASPDGPELDVWGRPQPESFSGNITYTRVRSVEALTEEAIAGAPFIHPDLLPVGSGIWGGVKDAIQVAPGKYILAGHRAWRTGKDGRGRHYESLLYGHDTATGRIVELGVVATADMFPDGKTKDDETVDLHDVTFIGGGYNGTLRYATFGVRDGSLGIAGLRRVFG